MNIHNDYIQKISDVRAAIVLDIERKNRKRHNIDGKIICPICGGDVAYTYAGGYNGHISAKCSTGTCVNWIE